MVTARRAPVVGTSFAIVARLRVGMLARGHYAPAPRHLSERRTLIGGLIARAATSHRSNPTTSRASAGRKTRTRVADDRLGR
ncbi:hypothetical protein T492DRAFT_984148 [Pavlovales sp. CCMP2436]|nr:hypothetical protein T492DRAFT_984148 [Pavlovales sp. CCMP2436]